MYIFIDNHPQACIHIAKYHVSYLPFENVCFFNLVLWWSRNGEILVLLLNISFLGSFRISWAKATSNIIQKFFWQCSLQPSNSSVLMTTTLAAGMSWSKPSKTPTNMQDTTNDLLSYVNAADLILIRSLFTRYWTQPWESSVDRKRSISVLSVIGRNF